MTAPTVYAFPALGFEQISFDLIVPRNANRMEGRRTEARLFGMPYWTARFRTVWLDHRDVGKADAWIRRVVSRGGVFRAHDVFRPRPIDHDDGNPLSIGAFDGTATLAGITTSREIDITDLPANFQLREGDYVEIAMSGLIISLHSIEADAQADGSGAVTLSIDPALDTGIFTTAATVNFEKPSCIMQPFDWSGAKSWQSRNPEWSAQEVFFYEPEEE